MSNQAPGDVRVFRLDPARQRVVARRRLAIMLPMTLVFTAGAQFFSFWLLRQQNTQVVSTETMVAIGVGTMVFCVAVMLWSVRRAQTSYRLHLGPDWLRIEMNNLAPIEVHRRDVRLVRERVAGLEIHRTGGFPVGVSRGLDGYDQVRDALLAWSPASAGPPSSAWTVKGIANLAAVLGLFGLSGLSYAAKTPAASFTLAGLASVSGVWLWWAFRDLPIKRKGFLRAYWLMAAIGVLFLNLFRWTQPLR
jgi:hypothetical protein